MARAMPAAVSSGPVATALPGAANPTQQRPMLALGLRLAAMAALSVMLVLVKLSSQRGTTLPELIFWRQLLPALIVLGYLALTGGLSRLRTQRLPDHARRAVMGVIGMYLNLGAVILLPLAEATVLGFTAPIFAVILAALLLREHVGPIRWLAVALGLAGVIVIAGPDRANMPLGGLAVGIGAAFMIALIAIQLRDLGRTEEPLTIVFWFSALSAPPLALALLWSGVHHDVTGWLMLLGIGVTGVVGQVCLTAALRFGSVSSVIVMDYSAFGWATLWGWLVFDRLPPAATWIGAPAIIGAGLVIAFREHRLSVAKPVAAMPA
jgi:drug/metabolite transporter (DMT)-like permease